MHIPGEVGFDYEAKVFMSADPIKEITIKVDRKRVVETGLVGCENYVFTL